MAMIKFLHPVKTFYYIARQSFLNSMVFRANYFIDFFIDIVFIYLSVSLWSVIFMDNPENSIVSKSELITYMGLARIVARIDMGFVWEIQNRILNGEIASELTKPINIKFYHFSQEVGSYFNNLIIKILPIYLLMIIVFDMKTPINITQFSLFLVSLLFSFLLIFNINFITAIMAFWITKLFSLSVFKDQTIRLLSGAIVPLWFFPDSVLSVVKYLPFSGIVFMPINIYLNKITNEEIINAFLVQIIWIIVTSSIGRYLWFRATRRISINGG
ncbi:ABC transporter permease [Paenibacillus medicaginis]|uniref:ABC transporter permease n=1 Tax=Paenibacillus medicaginis TaxID=1470560 RepID=A0ABV5C7U0_9BACL